MNERNVSATSQMFEQGVNWLSDYVQESQPTDIWSAPIYFLLEQIEPGVSEDYIKNFDEKIDDNGDIWEARYERLPELTLVAKLAKQQSNLDTCKSLVQIKESVAGARETTGRIDANRYRTTAPLWYLSQFDNISVDLSPTVDYIISDDFLADLQSNQFLGAGWAAMGVLALSEIDYIEYQERIDKICSRILDQEEEWESNSIYERHYIYKAMNRSTLDISNLFREEVSSMEESLSEVTSDYWNDENTQNLSDHSFAEDLAASLLLYSLAGAGLHEPVRDKWWESEQQQQMHSYSNPDFLATVPSTNLQDREVSLHDKIKNLISSSSESIYVSALRIDMLYEDIIDRIEDDSEIDVKIITNTGTASGSRKKMKKAVMNELVKRLDGNVKEGDLIHARMIISDENEIIVSTADLTRDQLFDEYNAGIHTREKHSVNIAVDFFEKMWSDATPRNIKK